MNDKEVKYKYKFAKDYNPVFTNGAQGGINVQGEIVINFYLERIPLPISETFPVEDGVISSNQTIKKEPEDFNESLIRYVQNGVIMDYKTAKKLHHWLGRNLETLEEYEKSQHDDKK